MKNKTIIALLKLFATPSKVRVNKATIKPARVLEPSAGAVQRREVEAKRQIKAMGAKWLLAMPVQRKPT